MRNLLLTVAVFLASATTALADGMHFRLSPNPASSFVNVQFDQAVTGDIVVEVYSVLGTRIIYQMYHHPEGTTALVVNTSNLAEGIYLVRVSSGNESTVKRIKIQHG